jgi:hypothetical protein
MRATSLRSVDFAPVRVPAPAPTPARQRSAAYARTGARVVVAAVTFLSSYALLQILHATGHDPPLLRALLPIPLFARCAASGASAALVGFLGGAFVGMRPRLYARLPTSLAFATAVFVAAVVLFP